MKTKFLLATLTALSTSLASVGSAETMIRDIEVTTDLAAISNPQAAAYWGNVSEDLKEAIAARLVDQLGEEGSDINIDVNELSLSNSFQSATGLEDAVLVGNVSITSDTDNSKFDNYELTISAKAASAYAPDGTVLEGAFTDTPEYYSALITAFADGVVTRLK